MHAYRDSKQFIEWFRFDCDGVRWNTIEHTARWISVQSYSHIYLFELINGNIKFMRIDLWYCLCCMVFYRPTLKRAIQLYSFAQPGQANANAIADIRRFIISFPCEFNLAKNEEKRKRVST